MVTISKCNWLINIYWSPWARRSNFGTKLKCWRLHDNWKFHILGTRVHFSYFLSKSCLAPAVCEEIIKRAEADNFQVLSCNIFPLHLFSLCFFKSAVTSAWSGAAATRRTPRAGSATPPCSRSTTPRSAPARRTGATPHQGKPYTECNFHYKLKVLKHVNIKYPLTRWQIIHEMKRLKANTYACFTSLIIKNIWSPLPLMTWQVVDGDFLKWEILVELKLYSEQPCLGS